MAAWLRFGPCSLCKTTGVRAVGRATGVPIAVAAVASTPNLANLSCLLSTLDNDVLFPVVARPSLPCRVPIRALAFTVSSPGCNDSRPRPARRHASTRSTKWPRQRRHAASALGTQPTAGQSTSRQNAARSQPAAAPLWPQTSTRQRRRRALPSRSPPHRRSHPTRPPRSTLCRGPRVTHCPRWQAPLARQPIRPLDSTTPTPALQQSFTGHEHLQRHRSRLHPAHQRSRHESWWGEQCSGLEPRVAAHATLHGRRSPRENTRVQQRRLQRRERARAFVQEEDGRRRGKTRACPIHHVARQGGRTLEKHKHRKRGFDDW